MAQITSSFNDDITFTEGPFVVARITGEQFRLEQRLGNTTKTALPEDWVYQTAERERLETRGGEHAVSKTADFFNKKEARYIYRTYTKDTRYSPLNKVNMKYHPTQAEAIAYLQRNGGGWMEDLLNRYEVFIYADPIVGKTNDTNVSVA